MAAELLERNEDPGLMPCPICGTSHEPNDLRIVVSALSQADGVEDLSDLRATEEQLRAVQEADRHVQQLRNELKVSERCAILCQQARSNPSPQPAQSGPGMIRRFPSLVEFNFPPRGR